jgi:hypothetical protein
MRVIVYGLVSSADGVIRYIGQTVQPVNARLRQHVWEAKRRKGKEGKSRRVWNWIASVYRSGHKVIAIVLDDNAVLHETEMKLIREYREKGFDLINATKGGEGTIGFKHHMKRPWVAEMNKTRAGIKTGPLSDEHKKKVGDGNRGKKKPWMAERNRERARTVGGHPHTEESKAKISKANKGKTVSQEARAKISAKAKGRKLSPEAIAKLREGHANYYTRLREEHLEGSQSK